MHTGLHRVPPAGIGCTFTNAGADANATAVRSNMETLRESGLPIKHNDTPVKTTMAHYSSGGRTRSRCHPSRPPHTHTHTCAVPVIHAARRQRRLVIVIIRPRRRRSPGPRRPKIIAIARLRTRTHQVRWAPGVTAALFAVSCSLSGKIAATTPQVVRHSTITMQQAT
jgi:hypothetical protein